MSITGDNQNININGNLVIPNISNKFRTPKIEFFDDSEMISANGIFLSNGTTMSTTQNIAIGSNIYISDVASNLIALSGNISASYLSGNASLLGSLTGATPGIYGNATTVSQITVSSTGRITGISNVVIQAVATSNLQQVTTAGNATTSTVLFQNAGTSFVTSGNVGISNVNPVHTLDVGSNTYISDTQANTIVTSGNVSARYLFANGQYLTSLTGAGSGAYGSGSAVPTINVDSTGRITSISTTSINTVSTATPGQVAYYTGAGAIGGDSGLSYTAGTQTLVVGGGLTVNGDLVVAGNTYTGNNVVFNDAIVEFGNSYPNGTTMGLLLQRPAGNVMMGYLSTENGSAYNNTLAFGYTFGSALGPLLNPDTSNILPVKIFGNLTTTSNLYVGSKFVVDSTQGFVGISNATPGYNLVIGSNLFATDTGSNVIVTSGNVSASYYSGNASLLGSLTGAAAGTYGNATTVSQITVSSTGRITGISNVAVSLTLDQVVSNGNTTSNSLQLGGLLVTGTSNLVGNTVASNISVYSISFGGTSNGYVRSINLQDVTDIGNVTTSSITVAGITSTSLQSTLPTAQTAFGTWSATPTPILSSTSSGYYTAVIGASLTDLTPSGGRTNGTYTIFLTSNSTWSIPGSFSGCKTNLTSTMNLTASSKVIATIMYDGTTYYVSFVQYS